MELGALVCFALSMIAAVYLGGPSDLARAVVISVPYLLLGMLIVRRELLVVSLLPVFLSIFLGHPGGGGEESTNQHVVLWIGGLLLFLPMLVVGAFLRRSFRR